MSCFIYAGTHCQDFARACPGAQQPCAAFPDKDCYTYSAASPLVRASVVIMTVLSVSVFALFNLAWS